MTCNPHRVWKDSPAPKKKREMLQIHLVCTPLLCEGAVCSSGPGRFGQGFEPAWAGPQSA